MANKTIVKSEMLMNAPISRAWRFLTNPERFARLFSPSARAEFTQNRTTYIGTMKLGDLNFNLKMTPYDVLLSASSCTIVMRLCETDEVGKCSVVMASSYLPESGFSVRERDLFNVLSRLKSVISDPEAPSPTSEATPPTHTQRQAASAHIEHKSAHGSPKLGVRRIIMAAAALLLIVLGVLFIPRLSVFDKSNRIQSAAGAADLSALVTYENASAIALGNSKSDIEMKLGTSGIKHSADSYIYRSTTLSGSGLPYEQIKIVYKSAAASSITYLNLNNSTAVGAITNVFPTVTAGTLDQVSAAVGAPLSMFRRYLTDSGAEMLEAHYGYLDPFANFDEAWRGEIAVVQNTADGTVTMDVCKGYDGSDPLMVNTIADTPLQHQFDSYSDFLNDKYQYDKALLMLNHFSRGDAFRIFGEMSEYDAGSGAMVYRRSSPETVPDTEIPLYSTSFGFDATGVYSMSSFVNMRLMNKGDMLNGTRYEAVTRNMSYGEVRTLMGILPTAVFVNENFLTLCYGKYIDGPTTTEQQFELVVKLKSATMSVNGVYNNMTAPEASETPAENAA
ncbi:MAG: hypothetical protein RRZ42_02980 [Oscillospiraceae bacterium]